MNQIKSRERVADHGEVFTAEREVKAMLDLVAEETSRVEACFLEPACGDGNFLAEILRRKLNVVEKKWAHDRLSYERSMFVAISNLYGIDILQDNIQICRDRLYRIFEEQYLRLFDENANYCGVIRYVLRCNIVWGDALELKTLDKKKRPIIFSEWTLLEGDLVRRQDYMLSFLIDRSHQMELFMEADEAPLKEYAPVRLYDLGQENVS